VAALKVHKLDKTVKRRLKIRAAENGRSLEAEVRAILTEAVREPVDYPGLFSALLDRLGPLGGAGLEPPSPGGTRP
jgi:antitoxin FitA